MELKIGRIARGGQGMGREFSHFAGCLIMAACLLSPISQSTFAQEDEPAIEEIVVTGSRIPRADLDGVAPVATYSAEDIARSGATSIGQLLREIPSVAGGAQTTQINNGGGGVMQISLRGIGAVRTLVLVNGRRAVASVDEGANGLAVDLNTIPTSVIERVEVLKDGASAVYGSDAVAGVVNIITKKQFEGFELSAYAGDSTRGGGARQQVDLTVGGPGNSIFIASFTDEEEIDVTGREWAQTPLFYAAGEIIFLGSSAPPWGRYRSFAEEDAGRDCNGDGTLAGNCDLTLGPEYGDFRRFDYFGGDSYNYAPSNYQRQPNSRASLSFFGESELDQLPTGALGDLSGFLETTYVMRSSEAKLAEVPLAPLAFFGHPAPYSKDNFYNPLGADIPDWRRRMVEGGSRTEPNDEDTLRLLFGLRGDWFEGPLSGWSWEAHASYGESKRESHFGHIYDLERVANAVGPTIGDSPGDLRCANDTGNCVPLNTFGQNSVTQEMLDYLTFTTDETFGMDQRMFAVSLTTPSLFQVPAGAVGAAFGLEYRDEFAFDMPDPRVAALGDAATGTPRQPTSGGYDVIEGYLELVLPLLADQPLAELVEVEAAVRYSDYSAFGSTTNPKIGFRWRVGGDVVVRGSTSTAFRAPNVGELYGGAGSSFPSLSDPCSGGRTGGNVCMDPRVPDQGFEIISTQIRTRVGGNPDLTPEEADIYTVGLVWTPETTLAGLSVALDYYDYALVDAIGGLGADFILNACATRGELCDKIDRFPDGNVRQLDNRTANAAGLDSSGIDLALSYQGLPLPVGELDVRLDLTRILAHDVIQPDGTVIEHAQWFRDGQDGHFGEWKYSLGLAYIFNDNLDVSWDIRFIDDVMEEYEDQFTGEVLERTLEGAIYHDLQANWRFDAWRGRSMLTVGVDNVLDDDPSFSLDGFNDNTDVRTFDTVGRFIYGRVRFQM